MGMEGKEWREGGKEGGKGRKEGRMKRKKRKEGRACKDTNYQKPECRLYHERSSSISLEATRSHAIDSMLYFFLGSYHTTLQLLFCTTTCTISPSLTAEWLPGDFSLLCGRTSEILLARSSLCNSLIVAQHHRMEYLPEDGRDIMGHTA